MFVRAYLRASTKEQDATRARAEVQAFADQSGLKVAAWYIEHETGTTLQRPKLFELLADSHEGDILLIEQVDRLSRLTAEDWDSLKRLLADKKVKVVALDLPTSHPMMTVKSDPFTSRMFEALNSMMLDMLAAIARKDYEDRRRRQAQGIANAIAKGEYNGRPENTERNAGIGQLLQEGKSWAKVIALTGASRATVAKVARRLKKVA